MRRIKLDLQTGLIVVLSALIVLFLVLLGDYAVNDYFRMWFYATFKAESTYMFQGSDGSNLPLPPHTHDYYRQPVKDIAYYSDANSKQIVDYFKRIATPNSFQIVQGKGSGVTYDFKYHDDTYKLYFYDKGDDQHNFTIQIQPLR